jgi:branched-chain amino acid aminotransferase
MNYKIRVSLTENSRITSLDFDNIPFGKVFTDHMFVADYIDGTWTNLEIKPLEYFSVHPANLAWHYGQSIFEGMKASRDEEGNPLLFRPELHAQRFNASAERMCMPTIPEDLFVQAISNLVAIERKWIPPAKGSAMYIRPFMIATDEFIGVRPSNNYKFVIFTLPVGPYYSRPVKLKAEETYIRAAKGGVGDAKTAGNYAAALYPTRLAEQDGYDQVLWLDANEFKYIQEVGTMNIFFVIGDTVITPATTDGTILRGITRRSIIAILKDKGYKVEERHLSIDEVVEAHKNGQLKEVFGSGTAAVVAMVNEIKYRDTIMKLDHESYVIAKLAKQTIDDLRARKTEDAHGWIVPATAENIMVS